MWSLQNKKGKAHKSFSYSTVAISRASTMLSYFLFRNFVKKGDFDHQTCNQKGKFRKKKKLLRTLRHCKILWVHISGYWISFSHCLLQYTQQRLSSGTYLHILHLSMLVLWGNTCNLSRKTQAHSLVGQSPFWGLDSHLLNGCHQDNEGVATTCACFSFTYIMV